jgi:glucan 1,3-beta-glucosidase
VNFKNVYFKDCTTAFSGAGFVNQLQGATFDTCGIGVDLDFGAGSLVLLDSRSVNSGPVVRFHDPTPNPGHRNNQIAIQNLVHDNSNPIVVEAGGRIVLPATGFIDTWVFGNVFPASPNYQQGTLYSTPRPSKLLSNGKFFTRAQPTYDEFALDQFVNVKAVPGFTVKGDGRTDDSAALNAILLRNAADCKIT